MSVSFPATIGTPRLLLRRMMRYDAPALHAMFADAETMRYWSALPHIALAETERFVAESIAAMARGDAHDFVVLHEARVIGRVAFWMANEIGFLFDRAHWGRGFAQEAVTALLGFGFEALGFRSAKADVDPENARSLKLLERLGFQRTGFAERTFKLGDRWADSVYLELAAAAFRRGA
ncbi:MAG TPA: GNAT family N-acetyltransferase [Candidatus Cybelea sp.]|nr:GNAT family N-acetyltransferase [Candidatus Cybelea sp.]